MRTLGRLATQRRPALTELRQLEVIEAADVAKVLAIAGAPEDGTSQRVNVARAALKALADVTSEEETAGMRNAEFDFSKLSVAERIQLAEDL